MNKATIIKYSIFGVIGIAVIVLFISLFTAYKNKSDNSYKELIAAKDESIRILADQTRALSGMLDKYDQRISEHEKRDSVLNAQYLRNQMNYKINDEKLANISARINRIADNNDSLRLAIANL